MQITTSPHATTISPELRAELAAAIARRTVFEVARILGIGREVALRLVAGIPVRAGSVSLALAGWGAIRALLEAPAPAAAPSAGPTQAA